jgi:hypothetical protein
MVTRNQANNIADALLAEERARSTPRSGRRHWAFPELDSVEPAHRAQVLRVAYRSVMFSWPLHLVALGWIAAYALTWGFLVPEGDKHAAFPVFALGATVPIPFFYGACVRRQLRRIARSMAARVQSAPDKP